MSIWAKIAADIAATRSDLIIQGYTNEDMDNVFGEDGIHFPKSANGRSKAIHIIGLLINNNQYKPEDKNRLTKMVNDAYKTYKVVARGPKPKPTPSTDDPGTIVKLNTDDGDASDDKKEKGWKALSQGTKIAIIGGSVVLVGLLLFAVTRNK
jgi:hypothetical protein